MDKIQELHRDEVKSYSGEWSTSEQAESHAAITEDLMGRFAEWKDLEGWSYVADLCNYERIVSNKTENVSTAELIQLFKEQL